MNQKSETRQSINGILLLDKPQGLTSNNVLQKVKRLFNAKKAGHTGSLDPLATGMLPICFGDATKFSQYLLDADKTYETTGRLGIKTDTGDAMGNVAARMDSFSISESFLQTTLQQFRGEIEQVPSMFSALKHRGKPLYEYARKGIEVSRSPRKITIYQLELNHFDGINFSLTVTCSKGTYIRNLVEDIGERLGTYAHVTHLHRTHSAGFADYPMVTFEQLNDLTMAEKLTLLHPVDKAVEFLPSVRLDEQQSLKFRYGQLIALNKDLVAEGLLRVYDGQERFVGLGERVDEHHLKAKRLMAE